MPKRARHSTPQKEVAGSPYQPQLKSAPGGGKSSVKHGEDVEESSQNNKRTTSFPVDVLTNVLEFWWPRSGVLDVERRFYHWNLAQGFTKCYDCGGTKYTGQDERMLLPLRLLSKCWYESVAVLLERLFLNESQHHLEYVKKEYPHEPMSHVPTWCVDCQLTLRLGLVCMPLMSATSLATIQGIRLPSIKYQELLLLKSQLPQLICFEINSGSFAQEELRCLATFDSLPVSLELGYDFGGGLNPQSLSQLQSSISNAKRLHLRGLTSVSLKSYDWKFFEKLKNLQVLSLRGGTMVDHLTLKKICAHCPQLTSLDVSQCLELNDDRAINAISKNLPLLKILNIAQSQVAYFRNVQELRTLLNMKLTELYVSQPLTLFEAADRGGAEGNPFPLFESLERLVMDPLHRVPRSLVKWVGKMPNLRHLSMRESSSLKPDMFRDLFVRNGNAKNLRSVTIPPLCVGRSFEETIFDVVRNCPSLEKLEVNCHPNHFFSPFFLVFDDDGPVWARLPNLRHLVLTAPSKCTGELLRELLSGCTQLELLDLRLSCSWETFDKDWLMSGGALPLLQRVRIGNPSHRDVWLDAE